MCGVYPVCHGEARTAGTEAEAAAAAATANYGSRSCKQQYCDYDCYYYFYDYCFGDWYIGDHSGDSQCEHEHGHEHEHEHERQQQQL